MTKLEKLIAGLQIIGPKVRAADFSNSSGMAIFKTEPLTDEEQIKMQNLGWSSGANRSGIDDAGPWQ